MRYLFLVACYVHVFCIHPSTCIIGFPRFCMHSCMTFILLPTSGCFSFESFRTPPETHGVFDASMLKKDNRFAE